MSAQALRVNYQGAYYMPIRLKEVMVRHGLRQTEFFRSLRQSNGKPISTAAGSLILNWDTWPRETSVTVLKAQIEAKLRNSNIPEEDIAIIWQVDSNDEMRNRHPAGVHPYKPRQPEVLSEETLGATEMLSPQAKKHFSLFRDPFSDDINEPKDVFVSPEQRYIREAMFTTAKHGGLCAVVAESGGGKSVLRRDLIDRIQREALPISVIFPRVVDKTRMSAGSICEAIIRDLQPEARLPTSLEAKARMVEKALKNSSSAGNNHVIIIEEAHDLTISTLKLLKRFWEIEEGFRKLISSIILIGQPELKSKLDERVYPEAREFIRRCELVEMQPLGTHLEDYVAFKFKRIGAEPMQIFEGDAYDAMHDLLSKKRLGCYPLIVNNLITKAMNLAADIGEEKITAEVISKL